MTKPLRCCVFCGSQFGRNSAYKDAAVDIGSRLVRTGFGLVYGGGHVGLMGTVADAGLAAGGEVIGVIPQALDRREVSHQGLTELHLVESMYRRKQMMAELSHCYLVLPGGIGTLDELFEVMTATQLGFDRKPIGLLNVDGYFDGLLTILQKMNAELFLTRDWSSLLVTSEDPQHLVQRLWQAVTE